MRTILLHALPLLLLAACGGGSSCPDGFDKNAEGRCVPADGADAGTDGSTGGDGGCDAVMLHRDDDRDGFGLDGETMLQCPGSDGWAERGGDCDDTDAAVNPDAEEQCNGLDDDCDGTPDQGLDSSTFYRDADGDGYGAADETLDVCAAPEGWVEDSTDCDDGDAAVHPGATEVCDWVDQNCDDLVDEGLLEPVGEPKVLGDGPVDNSAAVAIDDYEAGYIVVWQRDDDSLRYKLLDVDGGSLTPLPQPVASPMAGDPQKFPVVTVVDDVLPPRAVIAWQEGDAVRARSIPLDASTAPEAVEVFPDADTPKIVAARGEAVVVAVQQSPRSVIARRIDPETGSTAADAATVYEWVNPMLLFHHVSYVDAPSDALLLGVTDQRGGDLTPQGYLARIPLPSLEAPSTMLRLDPGSGRQGVAVVPSPLLETTDGGQPVGLFLSGTGAERTLEAVTLTNDQPPMIEGERSPLRTPGVTLHHFDATRRVAVTLYPAEPLGLYGGSFAPGRLPVASPTSWADPTVLEGADVAVRTESEGALALAVRPTETATTSEVRWQALGCEPATD